MRCGIEVSILTVQERSVVQELGALGMAGCSRMDIHTDKRILHNTVSIADNHD